MAELAKLREDLVVSQTEIDGALVYNIKDPVIGRYFRLREPEYWLATQLDGKRSAESIASGFTEKFALELTAEDVGGFITTLEQLFFLENARSEQATSRLSYGHGEKRSLFARLLFVKLKAFDPTKILDILLPLYKPFHHWFWFVLHFIVILTGVSLLSANFSFFAVNLYSLLTISSLATIVLSFFILVTLHEFAHAIICRYYGGEVRSMGFLLMYFQPCFYTDLSDAWLFKEKSHRLAVTWAGPYFQLIFLAVVVIVWRMTIVGTFVNELARITAIVSWITFLFNFNPLIKLDGYYLLSDWLDIPNLRQKAFFYFGNMFKKSVLGWTITPARATSRERKVFLTYAIFSLIYSIVLILYVLYLASALILDVAGPGGLVLFAAVILFTLRTNISNLFKGIVKHFKQMKNLLKKPLRLAVYTVVVILAGLILFAVPFPHRVSGEISVRPLEEFALTLTDLGYLESRYRRGGADPESKASFLQMNSNEMDLLELVPLIKDGQAVQSGDTVAILSSSQVAKDIEAETSELERLNRKLTLLQAPPKKPEIEEAEAELEAAQANYEKLSRDLKRITDLRAKKLVAIEEVETVQANVDIARAEMGNKSSRLELLKSPPRPEEEAVIRSEINKQRARLTFLHQQRDAQQIISPIAGVAVAGNSTQNILTVLNNSIVELLVPVTDFDIELIKTRQIVRVKVRSFPGRTFDGLVVHIPQAAEFVDEQARFMISTIVSNKHSLLAHGMTGYAKIEIGEASLFNLLLRKIAATVRVEFWSWW